MARWQSANLLQSNAGGRRLWTLAANGDSFTVQTETTLLLNEPCPPLVVGKDWQTLFRKKLNIAWLPADKVFFRAIHLPSSDPAEIASMVELQLEKVSPLPVTHIVWSLYLVPRRTDKPEELQTVVVIIAARSVVEEYLGQLSNEGFQPDRLEAPGLEQLLSVHIKSDGVWIFVGPPGEPALAVWWYGGTIQNLSLITLHTGPERGPQLRTQLEQIAWAGELEGWLNGPIKVHLIAGPEDAEFWQPIFKDWGESFEVIAPLPQKQLIAMSAKRCGGDGANTNLLPPEFAARYRQQFVDRLWLRGLMTTVTVYILGVLFYFGMLYVFQMQSAKAKNILAGMGPAYTNSMRDVEQIKVLKDTGRLKFAALDCWKAVAENLPDSLTVDTMYFQHGKFELHGTYTGSDPSDVLSFNETMRSAMDAGHKQLLFSEVSTPTTRTIGDHGEWGFNCTLKADVQ